MFNIVENKIKIIIGIPKLTPIRYIFFLCPHKDCKKKRQSIIVGIAPIRSKATPDRSRIRRVIQVFLLNLFLIWPKLSFEKKRKSRRIEIPVISRLGKK